MILMSNDLVNVTKDGETIGKGRILEADYTLDASEVFTVRINPNVGEYFSKNISASYEELTFIERPRN